MEVTVNDILNARDKRVRRQKELLSRFGSTVICFTMNIAGPVKCDPLIEEGFLVGISQIKAQLNGESVPILHFEEERIFTGCTAYFAVSGDPLFIKKLTSEVEDSSPIGRLFDIDVIRNDGTKVSRTELGFEARRCLICDNPAMVCSSSRAHSVSELQEKTHSLLTEVVYEKYAEKTASAAVRSLYYEVCTTPKPGLVDCLNSGSHSDMDIFTFGDSISVLYPYFKDCALCGITSREKAPKETFKELRLKGKIAQRDMLEATGGVNTHKGAIFSLGVLCAACGRKIFCSATSDMLLDECGKMVAGISKEFDGKTDTAGRRIYSVHGIKGIRGQAESGFPAVKNYGLPTLLKGIKNGLSVNDAGTGALLSIICNTEDTNMIKRSGTETATELKKQIETLIEKDPFPDKKTLTELDKVFTEKGVSAGGSADLLAMCYFLYFFK